jgi:hypothetical protein
MPSLREHLVEGADSASLTSYIGPIAEAMR